MAEGYVDENGLIRWGEPHGSEELPGAEGEDDREDDEDGDDEPEGDDD